MHQVIPPTTCSKKANTIALSMVHMLSTLKNRLAPSHLMQLATGMALHGSLSLSPKSQLASWVEASVDTILYNMRLYASKLKLKPHRQLIYAKHKEALQTILYWMAASKLIFVLMVCEHVPIECNTFCRLKLKLCRNDNQLLMWIPSLHDMKQSVSHVILCQLSESTIQDFKLNCCYH